ncbi:MAG: ribonuclease D [Alphaproteobacteria bacterium]
MSEGPVIITTTDALAARCAAWRKASFLAVDTEFMREKTYWPQLCLVQVGAPDEAVAIDPLAPGIDLAPLFELLVEPSVLKVFHAARQDIEVFHHHTGAIPTPIFDTQIAAMVCGFGEAVSYEKLVNRLAGAEVDKTMRFTDWARRPLTDRQILYALSDVSHLRPIYEHLSAELERSGRRSWLDEELGALADPALYEGDPRQAWRRLKPRSSNRRFLAILRELAEWREREAQRRDVPRNRIVRDEALTEIAAHAPRAASELAKSRSMSAKVAEGPFGEAILAAVRRARELPEEECPELPPAPARPTSGAPLAELLRVLLKLKSEESGVAPRLIASADDLDRIAAPGDAPEVAALHGWRLDVFGQDALALKQGRLALTSERGQILLVPREPGGALGEPIRRSGRRRRGPRRAPRET